MESFIVHLLRQEGMEQPRDRIIHDGFMALDRRRKSDPEARDRISELYGMVRRSNALSRITYDLKLSNLVKALIHLDEYQSHYIVTQFCRMDPPKCSNFLLRWHQESYTCIPGVRNCQLWAPAIGRNSAETGSMVLLRGSSRHGELPHYLEKVSPVYTTHGIPQDKIERYSEYEEIIVEADPGDVVLFHPHLLHRSHHNGGNTVRFTPTALLCNPYSEHFRIMGDTELARYHRRRCVNAADFGEFIEEKEQVMYW